MRRFWSRAAAMLAVAWVAAFTIMGTPAAKADSARYIDSEVRYTLRKFFRTVHGSRDLVEMSSGVLVFPSVIKAGFGVGGEYGEGALLRHGRTVGYYNTVSASIGFQLGAQARSVIIVFMTPEALASFRAIHGWKVGVDGSVAIIAVGIGASIDTSKIVDPVVGFIFNNKGLMYNLTLEGSKISRIYR